jgi:RNase P subunit RPR2
MYDKDHSMYTLECESCGSINKFLYYSLSIKGAYEDGDILWKCKCGWKNTLKKEAREDSNYISLCNKVVLPYPGRWSRCHECHKSIYIDRNNYSLTASGEYKHTCGFCNETIVIQLESVSISDMNNPIPPHWQPTITHNKTPILFHIKKRMPRFFRYAIYTIIVLTMWKCYTNLENIFTYFFR